MKEKRPRLIGSDGELLIPVKVEKSKHQPDDPSLNQRLFLMVLIPVLLVGVAALAVVGVPAIIRAMIPSPPTIATIPGRFARGPYEVGLSYHRDDKNPPQMPCSARRINAALEGAATVNVHLWAAPDHGTYDQLVSLSATHRSTVFDIPASEGDMFNVAVNDTQDTPLAGLEQIRFGNRDYPICEIDLTISPIGQ